MRSWKRRTRDSAMKSKQYFPKGGRIKNSLNICKESENYRFKNENVGETESNSLFGFGSANGCSVRTKIDDRPPVFSLRVLEGDFPNLRVPITREREFVR